MVCLLIWRKQGTCPDRLLSLNDVMFTCYVNCTIQRRINASLNLWLSQLASTFVLALVEEMLTPLNSLYFSSQIFLKILAKKSKAVEKCFEFTAEYLPLFVRQSENRNLGSSNNKLSKLANIFVFALVKGIFIVISCTDFYEKFYENFATNICLGERKAEVWGK